MAENNPLRYPSFDQLGLEFYNAVEPALRQLGAGASTLDGKATAGLARLARWLDAPCTATVKLDGSNCGVDDSGLIVGRNTVVPEGESYQKVPVHELLRPHAQAAAQLRKALQQSLVTPGSSAASHSQRQLVGRTMLYGEVTGSNLYDYERAGVLKGWLCFGVLVQVGGCADGMVDGVAAASLAQQLRASGYNVREKEGAVLLSLNEKLLAALRECGVPTVAEGYRPSAISEADWTDHDGGNNGLPRFRSLRALLRRDCRWALRVLPRSAGGRPGTPAGVEERPLCEGLVLASEADGTLFKWKHAGEELGKVPEKLFEAMNQLQKLQDRRQERLLPDGTLEVFQTLLQVATTKHRPPARTATAGSQEGAKKSKASGKKGRCQSMEEGTEEEGPNSSNQAAEQALSAWESALTKVDLDAFFSAQTERGQATNPKKKGRTEIAEMRSSLIEQVMADLMTPNEGHCELDEKAAVALATGTVSRKFGQRYADWARSNAQRAGG